MRKGGRELRPRPSWYDLPSRDVPRARQPEGQEQGLDVNLVNGRYVREVIYCFFFPPREGCQKRMLWMEGAPVRHPSGPSSYRKEN